MPNPIESSNSERVCAGSEISLLAQHPHAELLRPAQDSDLDSIALSERCLTEKSKSHIVCYLDGLTQDGIVEGWARDESSNRPCFLEIRKEGRVIAEAVADEFRQDLLNAGIGHGHYAFYACIHDATPGETEIEVRDARSGTLTKIVGQRRYRIPDLGKGRPKTIEYLLRRRRWSIGDVLNHVDCLRLSENLREMGTRRFVDFTFMFLLNRWMDESGLRYAQQLEAGEISPEEFFQEIALGPMSDGRNQSLPGPFDGAFPYKVT